MSIGFNIVWNVLYEHREYNHSGLFYGICVILAVLTCLPLIKTFCISLSKLRGRLFTIFTVYIVSVFLACFYNGRAFDRFSAWSCSLKRAVYNTPDTGCLECYIQRLSTLDTMQKIGVWEWVAI